MDELVATIASVRGDVSGLSVLLKDVASSSTDLKSLKGSCRGYIILMVRSGIMEKRMENIIL